MPFVYLGVLIFKGKPCKVHLQPIVDKIKAKLATWKGTMLSIMGRVQLVKSVIQGMLIYSFHIYTWHISLLKTVDQWIRNFIWSEDISTRKLVTIACKTACCPFAEGGHGIRPLRKINEVAILKLCWDLLFEDSQCACFLRARYLWQNKPMGHHMISSIWVGLKTHF